MTLSKFVNANVSVSVNDVQGNLGTASAATVANEVGMLLPSDVQVRTFARLRRVRTNRSWKAPSQTWAHPSQEVRSTPLRFAATEAWRSRAAATC